MSTSAPRAARFTDKVVVVAGGTRGIGRAVVELVAAEGASVIFCGRKPDACDALAEALRAQGMEALGLVAHVGESDDRRRRVEAALDAYGRRLPGLLWPPVVRGAADHRQGGEHSPRIGQNSYYRCGAQGISVRAR